MKNRAAVIFLWIAVLALLLLRPANAQTINWGNAANLGDINFDSTGSTLDATYTFALGVFEPAFDPATESVFDWFANWTELDAATYDTDTSFFSASYEVTDNTYQDRQAYIWIYNQTSPIDETTEWVLITDADGLGGNDWTIPADGDQSSGTLEWRVSNSTTVVFGGLNDTQGAGEFTTTPPSFELQTHSFPPPIPEPGVFAFFGGALLLGIRRRRRGRNAADG